MAKTLTALPTMAIIPSTTPFPTQIPEPTLTPIILPVRLDLIGNSLQYVEHEMEKQGYSFDNEIMQGNGKACGEHQFTINHTLICLEEKQYNLVRATWDCEFDQSLTAICLSSEYLEKAIFGDQIYQEKILPWHATLQARNLCFDGYVISSGFTNELNGLTLAEETIALGECNQ